MKYIVMILVLVSTTVSWGQGHDIGNGGNGVICYTDKSRKHIASVELFDFWESHQAAPVEGGVQLGSPRLSVEEKILIATSRIALFDPKLAEEVKTIALSMAKQIEAFLVTPQQMPQINDSNPRVLPISPCYVEQFAVQWREPRTGIRRFAISERFYNFYGTTNDTRAGLLLHEALYRIAILNGASDSDGVRYFTYLIATRKFHDQDLRLFVQQLQLANLDDKRCRLVNNSALNVPVYIRGERDFHACSPIKLRFKRWEVHSNQFTATLGGGVLLQLSKLFQNNGQSWDEITAEDRGVGIGSISVLPTMIPTRLRLLRSPASITIRKGKNVIPCDLGQAINTFELGPDERIKSCAVKSGAAYVNRYGESLKLLPLSLIRFDDQLNLQSLVLAESASIPFSGTRTSLVMAPMVTIFFDVDERVVSGTLDKALTLKILEQDTPIEKIEGVGPQGGAVVRVFHDLNGLYHGRRILRAPGLDGIRKAEAVCRKMGYSSSSTSADFMRNYVTHREEFYNQITDRFESKTDEFVEILPRAIRCFGTFEVKI